MNDQHVIIVRANLTDLKGEISVDLGSLSPSIASLVLYYASMALEQQPGPMVTMIHNDVVVAELDSNEINIPVDDDDE